MKRTRLHWVVGDEALLERPFLFTSERILQHIFSFLRTNQVKTCFLVDFYKYPMNVME
jgi:hypothetical protein